MSETATAKYLREARERANAAVEEKRAWIDASEEAARVLYRPIVAEVAAMMAEIVGSAGFAELGRTDDDPAALTYRVSATAIDGEVAQIDLVFVPNRKGFRNPEGISYQIRAAGTVTYRGEQEIIEAIPENVRSTRPPLRPNIGRRVLTDCILSALQRIVEPTL